jgi:hypothetical protein
MEKNFKNKNLHSYIEKVANEYLRNIQEDINYCFSIEINKRVCVLLENCC